MKKLTALVTAITLLFTVSLASGQTSTPAATPSSVDLVGSAVAAVAVIVVFAFIVYAGYKIIKKWSGSSKYEPD